jgi:hypothetical protein
MVKDFDFDRGQIVIGRGNIIAFSGLQANGRETVGHHWLPMTSSGLLQQ